MKTEIYYTRRQVWGNELFYPACKQGELLLSLTGRKTFLPNDFKVIRELGFEFKEKYGKP